MVVILHTKMFGYKRLNKWGPGQLDGRVHDSGLEVRRFDSQQQNFLHQSQLSVLILILASIPPPVLLQQYVKRSQSFWWKTRWQERPLWWDNPPTPPPPHTHTHIPMSVPTSSSPPAASSAGESWCQSRPRGGRRAMRWTAWRCLHSPSSSGAPSASGWLALTPACSWRKRKN